MNAKIILIKDIAGLGEEGDVREVAKGYARNYLVPRRLATPYSASSLKELERRHGEIEKRKEEKRRDAMGLKERLEAEELTFAVPAGESGKLFGSISNAAIASELEKKGYAIERKRIEVPDHNIRVIGTHTVKVKLYGNEEADLRIVVEASAAPSPQP